jgi:hypothetical protein
VPATGAAGRSSRRHRNASRRCGAFGSLARRPRPEPRWFGSATLCAASSLLISERNGLCRLHAPGRRLRTSYRLDSRLGLCSARRGLNVRPFLSAGEKRKGKTLIPGVRSGQRTSAARPGPLGFEDAMVPEMIYLIHTDQGVPRFRFSDQQQVDRNPVRRNVLALSSTHRRVR